MTFSYAIPSLVSMSELPFWRRLIMLLIAVTCTMHMNIGCIVAILITDLELAEKASNIN